MQRNERRIEKRRSIGKFYKEKKKKDGGRGARRNRLKPIDVGTKKREETKWNNIDLLIPL